MAQDFSKSILGSGTANAFESSADCNTLVSSGRVSKTPKIPKACEGEAYIDFG
jgi:hypothetical protein